jgi:hypothetical protein
MAKAKAKPSPKVKGRPKAAPRFRGKLTPFEGAHDMHYLPVPKAAVHALGGELMVRLICTFNGDYSFPCALMRSSKRGVPCIFVSYAKMKDLGVRSGALVRAELKLDRSKYGMPLPEEFKECLKQDAEARKRFDKLLPGRRRNIIFFVSGIKNPEKRLNRAFQVLERLKDLPDPPSQEEFSSLFKGEPKREEQAPAVARRAAADEEFLKKFLPYDALKRD